MRLTTVFYSRNRQSPKETQEACEEFAKILAKLTTRGKVELMDCVYRYVDSRKTFNPIDPATEQEEST